MKKTVSGKEALDLLHLLEQIDEGYTPTQEEETQLEEISEFHLSNNGIEYLPSSLKYLTKLQNLFLLNTNLTKLPDEIGNLSNLERLYILHSNLAYLPSTIGNLSNLQALVIAFSPLNELPNSIVNLVNLESLNINDTYIRNIPSWIGRLKHLRDLTLQNLNLQFLPPEILNLNIRFSFTQESFIFFPCISLYNTTLSTQPISLFQQPRELIQAYFDSPKITVHEAKVIFLGDGGAGKTHTIHRIQNKGAEGSYDTTMTPGVEITSYESESQDLTLHIWDFGGQDIMPSIHRCFLTKRALYVIVVSTRTGNLSQQARYWLKTIDAFAPGAPVLIAVNCWEDTKSLGVNNEVLQEEFPNLLQMVIFSAKCSSQEAFCNHIIAPIEREARKLDSYSMELPESWYHIAKTIRKQTIPYIEGVDYQAICRENGLEDANIAQWLLEWFNDMGVCFSYSDDNGQPYQVLQPEWLTNAVYRILLEEGEPDSDGIVKIQHIKKDLARSGSGTLPHMRYEESECNAILAVMKKFRLAYPVNEREIFIPALCSPKTPHIQLPEDCQQRLEYELQYTYLPDCVVHQLMIWYRENGILPKHVWRRGLCVQERKRWAVITGDTEHAKLLIKLYVQSDAVEQSCQSMLKNIYQGLQEINKRLALEATDSILMHEGKQTAHFPVGPLLEAKQRGWTELPSMEDGEFHVYNVDQILGNAFDPIQVQAALEQVRQHQHLGSGMNPTGSTATTIYAAPGSSVNFIGNLQNGWSAAEVQAFAAMISEHQNLFTEEVMTKLIDLLVKEDDPKLKELGQSMSADKKNKKSPFERLKTFTNDAVTITDNAVTIGENTQKLYKLWKTICKAAPALWELFQNFPSLGG